MAAVPGRQAGAEVFADGFERMGRRGAALHQLHEVESPVGGEDGADFPGFEGKNDEIKLFHEFPAPEKSKVNLLVLLVGVGQGDGGEICTCGACFRANPAAIVCLMCASRSGAAAAAASGGDGVGVGVGAGDGEGATEASSTA